MIRFGAHRTLKVSEMSGFLNRCKKLVYYNFPALSILLLYFIAYKAHQNFTGHVIHKSEKHERITIRVNTYRRLDLLEGFMDYYATCDIVGQVQVVWSDLENKAPMDWLKKYPEGKYAFEIHTTNSLSNRFRPLIPVDTEVLAKSK